MSEFNDLLERQRAFFDSGRTLDLSFRKKQLVKLYEFLSDNEERIYEALWKDLRKSRYESFLTEVGTSKLEIGDLIKNLKKWAGPQKRPTPLLHFQGKSCVIPDPYGQNLIISPWNYPFLLNVAPLGGAMAAGNTVIIKPSEISTATESLISEMISELYEDQYIACAKGGAKINQELLKMNFDHIFFTGSPRVGKIVMEAASRLLTPVTLELGGKNPVIVDQTADIDIAAKRIAWGKLLNGGQTCIAPDYLMVHNSVKNEFLERIIFYFEKFYGKDPVDNPEYLKIVNDQGFTRLNSLLKDQNIIYGGLSDPAERYLSPTLVDEPAHDSPIMEEEIFGPVLPVLGFDDKEKVIRFIRNRPKSLSLYFFTRSRATRKEFLERIPAGNVSINDTLVQFANPHLPFGGVGRSGMGTYHGKHSIEAFSHPKSVYRRTGFTDIVFRYPPYRNWYWKVVRLFLK